MKKNWDHPELRGDGSREKHPQLKNHQKKKEGWLTGSKISQIINGVDHPHPAISLKVGENNFTAILDIQASTSFVNQRVARFLPHTKINQPGLVRGVVNNITYTVTGQTFLTANCSGMKVEILVAIIQDLTADVILGHDFLIKYEVILDYAAHEIFMGNDRQLRVAWRTEVM